MQTLFESRRAQPQTTPEVTDEYKIVSVRLRMAEFKGLSDQTRALGLTNNMALRIAVRRIGGFLETDSETRHQLDTIVQVIGRISDDISRLSDICEKHKTVDSDALTSHRMAFGGEFRKLDALLRNILNTSQRRMEGRLLLQSSMTQKSIAQ